MQSLSLNVAFITVMLSLEQTQLSFTRAKAKCNLPQFILSWMICLLRLFTCVDWDWTKSGSISPVNKSWGALFMSFDQAHAMQKACQSPPRVLDNGQSQQNAANQPQWLHSQMIHRQAKASWCSCSSFLPTFQAISHPQEKWEWKCSFFGNHLFDFCPGTQNHTVMFIGAWKMLKSSKGWKRDFGFWLCSWKMHFVFHFPRWQEMASMLLNWPEETC